MHHGVAGHSADERDLEPGHVVGPFELLALVGRGGMARVWSARERATGAVYALKMLRSHLAENEAFRDMFFDEARVASLIRSENVARTFDLVDLDGILTLVMELVDGSSLVRILRPGPEESEDLPRIALPIREGVHIIAETCAGLHAAHELRDEAGQPLAVVHRDVSPHNVLVTRDGRVKITDFGIAKALGKQHVTIAGHVKGKLAYMSPEQLFGASRGVDRRSDVFAVGALLYEVTTGERAFQGEHDPQVMTAIISGSVTLPREVVQGYPAALEAIVMRALAPAPEDRWASAHELQLALEQFLAVSGPPVTGTEIASLLHERTGLLPLASAPPLRAALRPADPAHELLPSSSRALPSSSSSLAPMILAALVGIALGLAVLRSVYLARKSHVIDASRPGATSAVAPTQEPKPAPTPPPPPVTAPPPSVAPEDTAEVETEPPPAPPPASSRSAAPRVIRAPGTGLPPNPYE